MRIRSLYSASGQPSLNGAARETYASSSAVAISDRVVPFNSEEDAMLFLARSVARCAGNGRQC